MAQAQLSFKPLGADGENFQNEDVFSIIKKRKDGQESFPLELVDQLLGESLKIFFPVKILIESSGINSNFDRQIRKVFSGSIINFNLSPPNFPKLSVAGISGDFPFNYLNNIVQYVQKNNIKFKMGILERITEDKPLIELIKLCEQFEVLEYKTLYSLLKHKKVDIYPIVKTLKLCSRSIDDDNYLHDITDLWKLTNLKRLRIHHAFKFPRRTLEFLTQIPNNRLNSIMLYSFEQTIDFPEAPTELLNKLYVLVTRRPGLVKMRFRNGKTGLNCPVNPCFERLSDCIDVLGIRFENGITQLDRLLCYRNIKCLEIVCEEPDFADAIVFLDLPQLDLKKLRIIGSSNVVYCSLSRLSKLEDLSFISCLIDKRTFETLPRHLKRLSLINSLVPEVLRGVTVPFKLPDTIEFLNINGHTPGLYRNENVDGEDNPITKLNQTYLKHSHPIPDISNLKQLKSLMELNLKYSLRATVNKMLKNIPETLEKLTLNWIGEDITWIKNSSKIYPVNVTVPISSRGRVAWYTIEKSGFRMTFAIPSTRMSVVANPLNLKITEECKKVITKLTFPKRRRLKVDSFKEILKDNEVSHLHLRINAEINEGIFSKMENKAHYNLLIDELITPKLKELHVELCDDNTSIARNVWIRSEVPSTLKMFTINNTCQNTIVALDIPDLNIIQTEVGYGYLDVIASANSSDKSSVCFSQSKSIKQDKLENEWV